MAEYKDLIIPTVNVNDTKVTISDIQKENLEYIDEHEMLYCVETSKATEDYYPNYAGYVVLFVEDLDEVEVGKSAGMIFKDLDDAKAKLAEIEAGKAKAKKLASVNASKKAIAYAEEKGVDITQIKKDGIIKTQDVDKWIENNR
jgi:pyruvate/2-oxoglutarate dehydrogenase complex dihydrolipoamide acyltransferase (E2) component